MSEVARLDASVFATLPAELQGGDLNNEWSGTQPLSNRHRSLLEGPSFDNDGNLWCVDIPRGRIFKVSGDGVFTLVTEYDGWPNGLKHHRDGRIFVADHKHGIMCLDPVSGKIERYIDASSRGAFLGVNDLFFAEDGTLYFTDQGSTGLHDPTGRLFRVRSGQVECLLDNIPSPNGLVTNADQSVLYLAVTRGNCIWQVPFAASGEPRKVWLYAQLSGVGAPDGLALDSEGRLFIARPGRGSVLVLDSLGDPVLDIRAPAGRMTTNIAFGGPDMSTLFITEASGGSILKAELDNPGMVLFGNLSQQPL